MKAIRTEYRGTRFASQLEARWAVYMDTLGVRWVYEPEGYDFEDGDRYLPDFWLPEHDTFLEIKPLIEDFNGIDFSTSRDWLGLGELNTKHHAMYDRGRRVMHKLVRETGKRGVIAVGGFFEDEHRLYFGARADRVYYWYAKAPWSDSWHDNDEAAYAASTMQFDQWRRT